MCVMLWVWVLMVCCVLVLAVSCSVLVAECFVISVWIDDTYYPRDDVGVDWPIRRAPSVLTKSIPKVLTVKTKFPKLDRDENKKDWRLRPGDFPLATGEHCFANHNQKCFAQTYEDYVGHEGKKSLSFKSRRILWSNTN